MDRQESTEETVRRVASDVLGIPVERLRDAHSMTDLKATDGDYRLIFERSAEALKVEMTPIIETMPIYTFKAGDAAMNSLRMLAGISARAASLLDRNTVRPVDDTLGSIAEALRSGRFVDSGRRHPPIHQPYSARAFWLWALLPPFVALVVFPGVIAGVEYWQCCTTPGRSLMDYVLGRAWRGNGPVIVGGLFTALILGVQFLPGLWALRADARLRRDRRDI